VHYPAQVRTLVAHEPPLNQLLPEEDARRTSVQEMDDTYRNEGVGPAMEKFITFAGARANRSRRVRAHLRCRLRWHASNGLPRNNGTEKGSGPHAPSAQPVGDSWKHARIKRAPFVD
jgi:hypothetical protein